MTRSAEADIQNCAGAKSIAPLLQPVNTLRPYTSTITTLTQQARLNENPVLFGEITGGGSDDGSVSDYDLAALPDRLADVVFTNKVRRFLVSGRRATAGFGHSWGRKGRRTSRRGVAARG
jgi:hypothetical protein